MTYNRSGVKWIRGNYAERMRRRGILDVVGTAARHLLDVVVLDVVVCALDTHNFQSFLKQMEAKFLPP